MENCETHYYVDIEELGVLRSKLLAWYDLEKRELPWRTRAQTEKDPNVRAYAVWVSEVMLQQTQVATVIDYYNKWMEKWPTVEALARASLEEVRTAWTGLGYYSRGRRLWEGAKKVMTELGGVIPDSVEELMKQLPGVGRYTAGAVSSIAFNKNACVVDGNVARVLSRHRVVGGESSSQAVTKHLWELSAVCVDQKRPGDFNQAMMELGATVCTPKTPHCQRCPLAVSCLALKKIKVKVEEDKGKRKEKARQVFSGKRTESNGTAEAVEVKKEMNSCNLCLKEWVSELGVMNFPHKVKKKPPATAEYGVVVLEDNEQRLCLRRRGPSGLLAGLWEFPSVLTPEGASSDCVWTCIHSKLLPPVSVDRVYLGKVTHQFSHVHHIYHCWHIMLNKSKSELIYTHMSSPTSHLPSDSTVLTNETDVQWVSRTKLESVPISSAIKKILKLVNEGGKFSKKRAADGNTSSHKSNAKKQKTLQGFLVQKLPS